MMNGQALLTCITSFAGASELRNIFGMESSQTLQEVMPNAVNRARNIFEKGFVVLEAERL